MDANGAGFEYNYLFFYFAHGFVLKDGFVPLVGLYCTNLRTKMGPEQSMGGRVVTVYYCRWATGNGYSLF